MASHPFSLSLVVVFFFTVLLNVVSIDAELILEDGYTVTTVIDGHQLKINPHAVLSRPGSSDLIILDSSNSVFYTVSIPISQSSGFKRLSGDGVAGLSDGALGSARFNKPRSFTVDFKGNIYVADRINGTIRKISNSGVTTIAGGYSKGVGHKDGPAQNASFSSDFEVAFVPEECALLISDHGNQLVRQIGLKREDCYRHSQSALRAVSFWVLGLILSCLLGIVIGFVTRPYITSHEGSRPLYSSKTWKIRPIKLVKPILMLCFDIRSAVANTKLYELIRRLLWLSLSHLQLMLRINTVGLQTSSKGIDSQTLSKGFVSLLDSDVNSFEVKKPQLSGDELKDLISFSSPMQLPNSKNDIFKQEEHDQLKSDVLLGSQRRIDTMIQANIIGFAMVAEETTPLDESMIGSVGLVKRR
ncbi:uncharacterized protein LOC105649868 isoform X1 [Jatropha curcas]|uniref:uncharacterized protein LOC105649868 isoform X1 n=1 Tax=Jatropha curcas TaxID=180498 RepID=UPI0005FBB5D9|nr:uncharacterized protein LOC105649868 isoform X1 [Jatropha curcas]